MRLSFGFLLSIGVSLAAVATTARAQGSGIAGTYEGRYQCGEWHQLSLQIRDLGGGRIAAVFTFPVDPRVAGGSGQGSFSLEGQYDQNTGRVQLVQTQWIRRPRNYSMVGLQGVFDRSNRTLRGKVEDFNCQSFEVAPQGTALAPLPTPQRPVPPERGNQVFNLNNWMTGPLEYWDSIMDGPAKARESDPIDDVIDWLKAQDFSCLGTKVVHWNADGTQAVTGDRNDVRERYVIECDGDCKGLRYLPALSATMNHFGATQPVPVMEFKGIWLGGQDFQWKFSRPRTSTPPPEVFVHRWTSAKILSGQPCRAPKSTR